MECMGFKCISLMPQVITHCLDHMKTVSTHCQTILEETKILDKVLLTGKKDERGRFDKKRRWEGQTATSIDIFRLQHCGLSRKSPIQPATNTTHSCDPMFQRRNLEDTFLVWHTGSQTKQTMEFPDFAELSRLLSEKIYS